MNVIHQIVVIDDPESNKTTEESIKKVLKSSVEILHFFRQSNGALVGHIRFDPDVISKEEIVKRIEPKAWNVAIMPLEKMGGHHVHFTVT